MKRLWAATFLALAPGAAIARDSLGVFENWGAFRDPNPNRCYAIAEPEDGQSSNGQWRAFATIAHWPARKVRSQVHFRLSRERRANGALQLRIDDRRWNLTGGRFDAWAPTARHDAFIVAKLRSAQSMTISYVTTTGRTASDTYALKGAATAIDAAALGCARRT